MNDSMPWQIRRLRGADAAAWRALRLRGLQECPQAFSSTPEEEAAEPLDALAARLDSDTPGDVTFGAWRGNTLAGIASLACEPGRKLAHKRLLWGVYVAPEHRRRGLGRALLDAAMSHAFAQPGVRQLNLSVHADNHAAIALYRQAGFDAFGIERGYLRVDGTLHDEIHMACRRTHTGTGTGTDTGTSATDHPQDSSPEAVVQRQLDAYNARDVDALVAVYAEDAQLFEHPATLLASGRAALRERFAPRLREPNLHAHLLRRIVMAPYVVDHERIVRSFPEGPGTVEMTMIYEVRGAAIARAWSIVGTKTLDATDVPPPSRSSGDRP